MTNRPHPSLRIAYGDEPSRRADALTAALQSQGHEVVSYADLNAFLAAPEPDLYVLNRSLADGCSGLDLLEALRRVGRSAPVVLVDEKPGFADMRRAVELGATDFVVRPNEAGELTRAIERALAQRPPSPRPSAAMSAHSCECSYAVEPGAVGRAAREISAFLVNEGVVSAHRVRIASALAELVDNACRHGHPHGAGQIDVRAELDGARVRLTVEDKGPGFDVARARLERVAPALPGARRGGVPSPSSTGLGRVERLCEQHEIVSGPEGTRVELTFELTPVRFDEEAEYLAETDFLDPTRARELIASLRKGQADLSGVSPSLAITIGRLIGGLAPETRSSPRS